MLLCPHWLPSLGTAGEWGVGSGPWFCSQWVVKTSSAVKGLALGVRVSYATLEMASCSRELKPWEFLSAKLLSCTSWDTQGPTPRLPQPLSYSVSWGLNPPSSCADPASSLITKCRGANQHVQNPVTLSQSPLGGPAGPHSTIPGEPMDAPPGVRGVMGCRSWMCIPRCRRHTAQGYGVLGTLGTLRGLGDMAAEDRHRHTSRSR